jgi:alpha-mannosidase
LDEIWEDTLLFQFHDGLPGSSVNEANQDILARGRPRLRQLREIEAGLARLIAGKMRVATTEDAVVIFNTLAHPRAICDQIVPSGGWALKMPNTVLNIDRQETTTYERVPKNESFVVHTLRDETVNNAVPPRVSDRVRIAPGEVTTPFFVVRFGADGTIVSVRDAKTAREYVSGPANQFELYEDRPINWPAWDIQYYHKEMQIESPKLRLIEYRESEVIAEYEIARIGDGPAETSTIRQIITFSASEPFIDFQTVVNWTQHDKLLKVAFPTTIRARSARFGIQFGHIERPTHRNTDRDFAKFEAAGRWADLSEPSGGVSICSTVKSGLDVHEGIVRMSLLKAPMQTDKWADFGIRKFTYRVAFHDGGFDSAATVAMSDDLIVPPVLAEYQQPVEPIGEKSIPISAEFVGVSGPHVVLETLKPAFDGEGFVARFYESAGGWRTANVRFPLLARDKWEVAIVDLMERNAAAPLELSSGNQLSFSLAFKAFELVTVLVKPRA